MKELNQADIAIEFVIWLAFYGYIECGKENIDKIRELYAKFSKSIGIDKSKDYTPDSITLIERRLDKIEAAINMTNINMFMK